MPKQAAGEGSGPPITIDIAVEAGNWLDEPVLSRLCRTAIDVAVAEVGLKVPPNGTELSILFTDDAAIRELNAQWRGKDKATNVLSFPAFPAAKGQSLPPLLGDIVLAAETVAAEAHEEAKPLENHISHLVVHGLLHLAGYDHETDPEAEEMEAWERRVMGRLAIPDPYA